MKTLFTAILMMAIGSVLPLHATPEYKPMPPRLTFYNYKTDSGIYYKIYPLDDDSYYMLSISDKEAGADGYCMVRDDELRVLGDHIYGTPLLSDNLDGYKTFVLADPEKKGNKWSISATLTYDPKPSNSEYTTKRLRISGYEDKELVKDADAMTNYMKGIDTINAKLLELLRTKQSTYGQQKLACFIQEETGFMRMLIDENGKMVDQTVRLMYFNYGDYAEVVLQTHDDNQRVQLDAAQAEEIGTMLKLSAWKQPDKRSIWLDATRLMNTYYFFDGLVVSYDGHDRDNYSGAWMVDNTGELCEFLHAMLPKK